MNLLKIGLAVCLWGCLLTGRKVSADEFPALVNTEKSPTSPMDPQEVLRTAKLPPHFQLSLVAAEPQVQNPIAMTMDERGRLWIAENYSWTGAGFDRHQRDRIVILEDTDGDGIHDKRIVFWDKGRMLTSIEVGSGGVWAISLPQLLFFPDENRDDIPDGEPRVVLDGLDAGIANHTPANGLKWGPDGWLYTRQGILAPCSIGKPGASDSQRFKMDTGVWRYHPTRDVAEPVMHGMTNAWGYDFDQHGEMFVINTVIGHLWHVLPGAHTERMFGIDINPHSYKLIPQVADHVHWNTGENWSDIRKGVSDSTSAAGGGHAHIGLMIYQGDNWPEEYRNKLYTLNLHGRRLNRENLLRQGAGYTATRDPDLCFIEDPWFRGMELLNGPDGGVYIADWSDTGECHDHDGVHRTSGRIYKLTYGAPEKLAPFDLTQYSNAELIAFLSHPNTWWARQSRRILSERSAKMSPTELEALQGDLHGAFKAATGTVPQLRIMETIATVGDVPQQFWKERLQSENEYIRSAALKFLVDQETWDRRTPSVGFMKTMQELAASDQSGLVRLHLASSLQKLPVSMRWVIAEPLAASPEFSEDRMLPLMIWYGIEPAIPLDSSRAFSLIQSTQMPVLAELIARRITVELERNPAFFQQMLGLLETADYQFPEQIISGVAQGLNGWQKAKAPANWARIADKYSKSNSEPTRLNIQNLSVIFGDGHTMEEVRKNVANGGLPPEVRQAALRSLLISRPEGYVPTLIELLNDKPMVIEALRGLAQYDTPEIPNRILEFSGRFNAAQRAEMVQTLTSRPSFSKALLSAIRARKVAASELSAFHARQIASFENDELTKELTELWGDVRVSAAEKQAQIENFKTKLTPESLATGDLSAGRALFQKSCATCHILYGVGRRVGPDLTGSNRKNLDYLLENLIDPSASVGADFRTLVVLHSDGRVLNGVVSELTERTLTLQSAQEVVTLDRNDIEEMKPTSVSLMPEGQLQNLTPEQVRDLISYLMSSEQVPLPSE